MLLNDEKFCFYVNPRHHSKSPSIALLLNSIFYTKYESGLKLSMEEVCELQLNKPHLVTFYESSLVS